MTGPAAETLSVSELASEVREALRARLDDVWVAGEIQRLRPSRRGHLYFELVEKGDGDEIVGRIEAVLWRTHHGNVRRLLARTGQELVEGSQIRCRAGLDFYPPAGRVQLVVRDVDPVFSLGRLEARRRETLAALAKAGLTERNAALELSPVPLDLALVTAVGSAAYHDFLAGLTESGWGFRVTVVDAAVQGAEAEGSLASALAAAAALAVDAVVLIRGGGSRSDLAAFDSRAVAEAVATSPHPVITGLGHEIDRSIADIVAHTALKTPSKAAELLVERVATADREVQRVAERYETAARERLARAWVALGRCERIAASARATVAGAKARLEEVGGALARAAARRPPRARHELRSIAARLLRTAPRAIGRRAGAPEEIAARLVAISRGRLRAAAERLRGLDRLRVQLGPERALARGFSITRDSAGAVLREPAAVRAGERLSTELAGGRLISRVEEA